MKASFSFNAALSAPFAMARKRPLHLFVWGLMMAVIVAALYAIMVPMFAAIPFEAADDAAAANEYMLTMSRFSAGINGVTVLMYAIQLVVWTAAGRSALSPGRGDRFLFLRVGMDELRVAVAIVAVFFGWYIAFLILVLLGVGIGLAMWSVSEAATAIVLILYGLVVVAASIWALARVSLIAPASLVLQRFAFAEGWAAARGQVWKLIGLYLAVWVIGMVSMILMYAAVLAILAAGFFGQGLTWPTGVERVTDLEPVFRPMLAPILLTGIPLALGFGWMMALYAAPSVIAARQLLDGAPVAKSEDATPADTLQPL